MATSFSRISAGAEPPPPCRDIVNICRWFQWFCSSDETTESAAIPICSSVIPLLPPVKHNDSFAIPAGSTTDQLDLLELRPAIVTYCILQNQLVLPHN
jgi:hypothetical protein